MSASHLAIVPRCESARRDIERVKAMAAIAEKARAILLHMLASNLGTAAELVLEIEALAEGRQKP